nr:cyclin-I2 [Equus asinus]
MDSGARPPQQPAASEVRSVRRPDDMALCFLLRPPRWNVCLPAATRRSFPEACHPGAAGLPAPSPGGPGQGATQAPRAAGPAPDAAQGPQPPPPPPPPRPLLFGAEGRPVPCDWGGLLDERRLVTHLKLALGREARLWRAGTPQVEICDAFQEVVLQLLRLKNIFHFSQSTFNLALTIFSRLLASVKVKERLLQCVTITSLRLAVKFNEEEELIPRIKDFIKHYGSGYTPNELLRMELAILDKLHWDLYIGTPLDFLTIVSMRSLQSLP